MSKSARPPEGPQSRQRLDVSYTPSLTWTLPLAALAVLTGVSLGFAIAGWAATPEAANQLNIALFSPVFLLAGILYPLAGLPDLVRDVVVYVVPFTAVVEAFRGAVDGDPITEYGPEVLIGLGWLAVAFALASRAYRFTDERGTGAKSRLAFRRRTL